MQIIKGTNGFPYAWKAGRVEQLIVYMLENKAREQLDVERVMIINPTWLHETNLADLIKNSSPDFIICHNFVDPAVPKIFEAVEQSGLPHVIIGNAAQYRIDFWAMVCDLYFQHYSEQQLAPLPDMRKFICLNRKPHGHRQDLVNRLLPYSDLGYISLGDAANPIVLDQEFSQEQGIDDEYSALAADDPYVSAQIRNDIFSLGNLDFWNRSLLCLVTETEFDNINPNNFFISEKTWKPIIGMRPFFVYGQAPLRQYLKDAGFDIFEDLFDYSRIDETLYYPQKQQQYADVAVAAIEQINNVPEVYARCAERCRRNKYIFRKYVYKQWQQLHKLDLTNYV